MALVKQDRRESPRIADDIGIAIWELPEHGPIPHGHATIFHLTSDISRNGLRFKHDAPIDSGRLLKIHLALKLPLVTITHFGKVRWCSQPQGGPCDVGVEFVDSPPADMQIWQNYIAQCNSPASQS